MYRYHYQDPPTGHQLRPVRVQQPSTNSLLEGAGIHIYIYTSYLDNHATKGIVLLVWPSDLSAFLSEHPLPAPGDAVSGFRSEGVSCLFHLSESVVSKFEDTFNQVRCQMWIF